MFLLGLDWPIYTWPMLSSGCWYWKYPGRRKDKPRTSRVCCKQRRPVRRLSWQTYSPASESCNGEISKRLTPPVVLYRWKNHHRCCIAKHSSAYESCNDTISEWLREGFKTPSHGKCPLGGSPPPGALRTRFFCKVSEKKLNGQGGYPPPLTDAKSKIFSPQAAFFGVFHPKNTVFDPKS